jgi:23S rRNA (uracil1939-C5)-methyltransferase
LEITVEKLVYGCDGLARLAADDGRRKTIFVPLVLPGERVEVTIVDERPGFARANLDRIVEPAATRTEAPCLYFGACGGCHYQHATSGAQLQYKTNILRETVARIAKIELPEITPHASPPLHYRNRTRMKLTSTSGHSRFAIGYYRLGSHALLPVKECPISSPLINHALQSLWSLATTHELPRGLAEMEFFADQDDRELLVEFLVEPAFHEKPLRELARRLKEILPQVTGMAALRRPRPDIGEAIAAPELASHDFNKSLILAGDPSLSYRVGEFAYRVSAGSFFQANRFLTSKLLDLATSDASGKYALDLYAGVGLFTVALARNFERVTAVESASASFRDLVANAPATVKPIESTTEEFLAKFRGPRPEFVVADPPRCGLGQRVVTALAKLSPQRIVYVSCDPSTLSRDLPGLLSAGYRIAQAHLLDLFPQTFHIESVLRLER